MTWLIILLITFTLVTGVFYLFNKTNGQICSGGKIRRYLLYVPDSYSPDRPSPLVISIHGFVQWPAHQRGLTGWNELADEYGFLVVYPRGTGFPLHWNVSPIIEDQDKAQEDVVFFRDLIDHLCQAYNLDRGRIYANGMSNGGGMTHLLACKLSDRIAAFGSVAGAFLYPGICGHPGLPSPWIVFHGREDPTVPYQGGSSRHRRGSIQFPAIESWIKKWAEINGCADTPEREKISSQVTRIMYRSSRDNIEVVLYAIDGAGHTWPGGGWLPAWLTGETNQDINATRLMWEFFQRYSLDASHHLSGTDIQ